MAGRVGCDNCGANVDVPDGHTRAKIRCTTCGYYAAVPEHLRHAGPDDHVEPDDAPPKPVRRETGPPPPPELDEWGKKPVKARPVREAEPESKPDRKPARKAADDQELGPPLLEGTQEDDGLAYSVPGDGTKACQECNFRLPLSATFCTRCGTDLASGKKPKKKYQVVNREWESRWSLQTRLLAFAGLLALNTVFAIAVTFTRSAVWAVFLFALQTGLQAFLFGTYETIIVKRNAKGKASISKFWRVCFVKLPPNEVDWKNWHCVGMIRYHHQGSFEWIVFAYLFCCMAIVPALIFFFVIVHPVRYDVMLCDVHGGTAEGIVFRTTRQEDVEEICQTIADCTGLMHRAVM